MKKHRLAVHTIFLPRENLMFLKEWLFYHQLIGVDHFYLYDNTGSIGREDSSLTHNKYGVDFAGLTRFLSDEDVTRISQEIFDQFPGAITCYEWKPVNEIGQIVYGQRKSLRHVLTHHSKEIEWLCAIDLDEFLFSPDNKSLSEFLSDMDAMDVTNAKLIQKKFSDRFLNLRDHVIDIEDCIEGIDTTGWAMKNIGKADAIVCDDNIHIHDFTVKYGNARLTPENELRFNHYNVNRMMLEWMKEFYMSDTSFSLNAKDAGMKKYAEDVHRACESFGNYEWRKQTLNFEKLVSEK